MPRVNDLTTVAGLSTTDEAVILQSGSVVKAPLSILPFTQAGTGAVARTVQAKLREFVHAKDINGVTCDGSTDDWSGLNTYLTGNSNVVILFPPGSTTMVSQALPFRNNCGYACHGGWATIKAHSTSTDNVIGEASPSASYSYFYMENIIVDGNRANCSYNTRDAGSTDDAYQNGIRMDRVKNSIFINVRVQGSVMNGWSIYNTSDDNEFVRPWATNIGKSTNPAAGSSTYNGFFLEAGSNRNKLIQPHIDVVRDHGIWENSHGSASRDNWYIDPYINATTQDGIRIGNNDVSGAQQPLQRSKILGGVIGGVQGATSEGIRIYHSGTGGNAGTVDYPQIIGTTITGGAQHGVLIASTTVVDATLSGVQSLSNTGTGILNSGLRSTITGCTARLNGTDYSDTGTSTVEGGNTFDTSGLFKTATPGKGRHPIVNVLTSVGSAVTAPADTNDNTLNSITVQANSMKSNGAIRVTGLMSVTNSVNNKTTRIKFGGSTFAFSTVTTVATVAFSVTIVNRNSTNSQVSFAGLDFVAQGGAASTAAIDTTANQTLAISAEKASAGETMTLEWFVVELLVPNT